MSEKRYRADDEGTMDAPIAWPRSPGKVPASARLFPGALMRKARDAGGVAPGAEDVVAQASSSSGEALPGDVRGRFESSLGADLSSVRVHTGAESAQAASAVGAKAYTIGNDIHFGAGQYAPADPFGVHLLAHEVAHTQQQEGGPPTRQHKLEVSTPGDAAEVEADRAADAMVSGTPHVLGAAFRGLARKLETEDLGDEGEKTMMNGAAKGDLVLQVSNATDVGDATKILAMLEDNQTKIEAGVAMIDPIQRSMGEYMEDMAKGNEIKMRTQVSTEAIGVNTALISDLKLYLAAAGGQTMGTSEFQNQYKVLLADYGRLDNIATKYAGTSIKEMHPEGAAGVVNDAVTANGHTTEDLSATFNELAEKDPKVSAAREVVKSSSAELEKTAPKVGEATGTAVNGLTAFRTAVVNATVAQGGVQSLELRNAFQAAQTKAKEAERITDSVKEMLEKGGAAAAKTVVKGIVGAGAMTLSKWGALAAEGAATGGEAVAEEAADKLVIGPAKELLGHALENANAAVGIIDEKVQAEANIDKEKAKQDAATINAFTTAKATLSGTLTTAQSTVATWVKTAVDFESRKVANRQAFKQFADVIQTAAKARGKGDQGKALAEMSVFLKETEEFMVQADAVISLAEQGLGNARDSSSVAGNARAALQKIANRDAFMAHEYPFKKADGKTVMYYGAQKVALHIIGPGLDASKEELAGKGRADGFNGTAHDGFDPNAPSNDQSANVAITEVVPRVKGMRDRAAALRAQIMAQVFGTGGGG